MLKNRGTLFIYELRDNLRHSPCIASPSESHFSKGDSHVYVTDPRLPISR
jgi:hypothetical protein